MSSNSIILNILMSVSWAEGVLAKLNCCIAWFQIADGELLLWSERVALCLSDYASPECSKPNHRKLQWIVSRRTAQNLHSYRSVPELPTIPEGCWDESERSESQIHLNKLLTPSDIKTCLNKMLTLSNTKTHLNNILTLSDMIQFSANVDPEI